MHHLFFNSSFFIFNLKKRCIYVAESIIKHLFGLNLKHFFK
jgi:hypothetical protein